MKKILSITLSLIIIITAVMPVTTVFASEKDFNTKLLSQPFGNIELSYRDDEKTLYVKGEGMLVLDYNECVDNILTPPYVDEYGYTYNNCYGYDYKLPKVVDEVESLVISEGITLIGAYQFNNMKNLRNITLPKSLTIIGTSAFSRCYALTNVYYGGAREDWQNIIVDSGNNPLLKAEFYYDCDAPRLDVASKVKLVTSDKRELLNGLTSTLNYLTGEVTISGKGVAGAKNYTNASYGKLYHEYEFYIKNEKGGKLNINLYEYILSMNIEKGVTKLEPCFGFGLRNLKTVSIPASVTTIGNNCFESSSKLTDVYYYGTKAQWSKIAVQYGNDPLLNAKIHYMPAPDKVKNLKVSGVTNKSVTLSWSKAANASGYVVAKYNSSTKKWVRVGKTTKTSLKLSATAGCKYKFRVYAYREVNDGKKLFGGYTYLEAVAKPKGTTVKSLAAGKKKITVKWNKQATRTSGYQIEYSTNSSFKNSAKIKVSNPNSTSKAITGLKSGKKYYVRVRTYKTATVNGKKATTYSYWSTSKSVKVK